MMIDLWRDVVMKAVLERFSPLALKVLSDERVQTLLTQALNLQADMRENIEAQVKLVARTLELVTRDELSSLRQVVRTLEAEVNRLRDELDKQRHAAAARAAKPAPAPEPAPEPEPEPEPAPKKKPGRPKK
jgi:septal ring factor EnvC (AmiA/AmiB activator)